MKWKNRLTNYNFWISIVSATLLILQAFNIKLDIANINEIITALLGLLVVIGIINDPTKSAKDADATKAKTDKASSSTKHKKGCPAAEETDTVDANLTAEKTDADTSKSLLETEAENTENSTETISGEEQPCPACEEIKNAQDAENSANQNADKQCECQTSTNLASQDSLDAIMEGEIPSAEQNEADFNIAENDLQILIGQISKDIQNKYAELNKLIENLNFVAKKPENANWVKNQPQSNVQAEKLKDIEINTDVLAESTPIKTSVDEQIPSDNQPVAIDAEIKEEMQNGAENKTESAQEINTEALEMPTHFNIVN